MTNKWVYSSSGLSSLEWLDVSDIATQASVFCRFGETRRQTYTHSYTHTPNHTQNGNKTSFLCSTLNSCSAAGRLSAAWIPFTASSARFDAPFRVRTRALPFGWNQWDDVLSKRALARWLAPHRLGIVLGRVPSVQVLLRGLNLKLKQQREPSAAIKTEIRRKVRNLRLRQLTRQRPSLSRPVGSAK